MVNCTAGNLLLELHPALHSHLCKHFGDGATLAPHHRPAEEPRYLLPRTEPGTCFHNLPALATILEVIVVVDVGTTQARMPLLGGHGRGDGEWPRAAPHLSGIGQGKGT